MPTGNNDVFDIRRIRRLVELMRDNDLSEVDLQYGDLRMQFRRNVSAPVVVTQQQAVVAPPPVAAPKAEKPETDSSIVIKSPMIGTFYAASNPKSAPFVRVGDVVHPETTVCLIEAMKVYNEIAAEVSGKIVAVLVNNGDPVEFGKPLFKIEPI